MCELRPICFFLQLLEVSGVKVIEAEVKELQSMPVTIGKPLCVQVTRVLGRQSQGSDMPLHNLSEA